MQHTIRPLHEDDFPRSWYLGSHAFRGGAKDTSWRDNPNRHTRREWGLFEHDTMQARLALIPFTLQMGPDLQLAMGGIAGVVGAPAGRGRGYAGTLVRESLGWMREAGQCVSMLFPFSYSFYSRLGWEWVGENRTYTVKPRHLPKSRHSERVREASDADRPTVEACYAEFSRGYRGMIVRTPKHWNLVWEDGKDTFTYRYVYEVDGVVEGYLLHTGTKRRKVWIDEFICTTQRARFGLLALLKRHDMQIDRFEWEAPQDDSLWSAEMHHGYKTRLEPKCQARIVDITAAFSALRPDPTLAGRLTAEIQDEQADWNSGRWRMEVEQGRVRVLRTADEPDVSMTIGACSQAYFGTPNLDAVRRSCGLKVHNEAGYRLLHAVLAGGPMWCNDSF